jgi:uncharacterized protein
MSLWCDCARDASVAAAPVARTKERIYMETPTSTVIAQASPKGNDKIWTILCHLSFFVGLPFLLPLVVYLAMRKESAYVGENAREALNFHISVLIYSLCCVPLVFLVIGIPLLIIVGLASLILAVVAAIKASDGQCYRYPLTLRLV